MQNRDYPNPFNAMNPASNVYMYWLQADETVLIRQFIDMSLEISRHKTNTTPSTRQTTLDSNASGVADLVTRGFVRV